MKPFANHPYRALGLSLFTLGAAVSSALAGNITLDTTPAWNGTDGVAAAVCVAATDGVSIDGPGSELVQAAAKRRTRIGNSETRRSLMSRII